MDRDEELRQWFEISQKDLNVAKYLFDNMHPTPDEAICFHCQQSAEKDLKGFLFYNSAEFPKTHNLTDLLILCANISSDFSKYLKQCTFLTRYGVMPKYPNELQINDDEVKSSIRFADDIKKFVLSKVVLPPK